MENNENKKSEWLLKHAELSSFGRFVAIDWLQDLDTGRRLTPFPSSYHKTGELWVNDDDMLEVLVAPYPGPEAEEQVDSADHTVQTGGQDRVWQVVPGLPRWARFLRGNTPPDWPHVYGMAKRGREENGDEVAAIQGRPRKRAKRPRRGSARRRTALHGEEEQSAKAVLPTLTVAGLEEALKLLDSQEQQADPQSQLTNAELEMEEASRVEALSPVDAELENTFISDREASLELDEIVESAAITAQTTSPTATSSSYSSEDDASTTSSLFFVSPSPSPSLSDSPSDSSDDSSSESPSESSTDSPSPSARSPGEDALAPSSLFFLSTSPTPMRSSTSLTAEEDAPTLSSVASPSSSPCPSPRPPLSVEEDTTALRSDLNLSP